MQAAEQHCHQIVKQSGSTFALSFRFLNAEQRRGMRAVYAFCRVIDDVVDEPRPAGEKREQLQFWRAQLGLIEGGGSLAHPLTQELDWAHRHFTIPIRYMQELIDGVELDIDPQHYPDIAALLRYCYGVAGTVGLMCLRIFGVEETESNREAALALAYAFQLTNILRDIHGDALEGRVYLPLDDLRQFHLEPQMFLHSSVSGERAQAFREFLDFEVKRAEAFYAQAWSRLSDDDRKRMRPALVMSKCYEAILRKIQADPLVALRKKVRLTWWEKMCALWGRS